MTKQEHIAHWKTTADKDWKAVIQLFDSKSYIQSLFFAHLVLEKLLKAHWVKDNEGNTPPKTHNLVKLAEETKLKIADEDNKFFYTVNQFQLEGRYPDYLQSMYKKYKSVQTKKVLEQIDTQRKCLLKKLS